ncbi:hypothetical protein [Denitratimonas sp. CY0512]|uniref:hypothetical protein n=1 Tax=Denitratimonas sp. CY0512 TaxID=3131940 RepID=UPI0030ABB9AF
MKSRHVSRLFALALAVSLPAWSSGDLPRPEVTPYPPWSSGDLPPPEVTPHPPTPDQELTLVAYASSGGKLDCDLHFPVETLLSRSGNTFTLEYAVRTRSADSPMVPCVLVPMPVRLTASLGTLPAGDYEVVVSGTTLGNVNPDQHLAFTVAANAPGGTLPAPEVTPPNPTTADEVQLRITDGAATNGCNLSMPEPVSVRRNGRVIHIEYAFISIDESEAPPGTICFSAHFPAYFRAELGRLPAGDYEVTINGSLDGTPRATQQVIFAVTGTGDVSYIPANRPLALALMLLVLGGVAVWRLRAR